MKNDNTQRSDVGEAQSIPVFFIGSYFLPTEALKKRLHDEKQLTPMSVADRDELFEKAAGNRHRIIIYHAPSVDEIRSMLEIMGHFAESMLHSETALILVTRSQPAVLKKLFRRFPMVDILPSTIEVRDLYVKVQARYNEMAGSANTSPVAHHVEHGEAEHEKGSGIILFKGNKPVLVNGIQKGHPGKPMGMVQEAPAVVMTGGSKGHSSSLPHASMKAHQTGPSAGEPVSAVAPAIEPAPAAAAAAPASKIDVFFNRPMFSSVPDRRDSDRLINECMENSVAVTVFDEELTRRVEVTFTEFDQRNHVLSASAKSVSAWKNMFGDEAKRASNLLINFNLRRCRVFFKADQFEIETDGLTMRVPEQVYEVQRRAHLRLLIEPPETLRFSCRPSAGAPLRSYRLYDLSSGGVALLLDQATAAACKARETVFTSLTIRIGDRDVALGDAELCHMSPFKGENTDQPLFKAGFRFLNINPREQCFVNMFVYRESYKYLNRVLGE